ncbi:hypothetical protein PCANB_000524 [Pneumocystis canis]|nr:hypothetical protein PCANB_000524 [Pneumocystis canis]
MKSVKNSKNNGRKTQEIDVSNMMQVSDGWHANQKDKEIFKLICFPRPQWYLEEFPALSPGKINKELIEKLYIQANKYLKREEEVYNTSSHVSPSDKQFFNNIMESGTLSDKISALTLSIQESPLHSSKKMRLLLDMTKKRNRTEIIQSFQALKDLFISTILPNRKLKYFKQQEFLGSKDVTKKHLILWAFEDFLKHFYFEYLGILSNLLKDPLSFLRTRMVTCVFELIRDKPEQEQNLLRLLVNKLGDPEKKVASKTSYCILQLSAAHPTMKDVIISEIERLLFRSSVSQHAQYYAVITLNQIVLSKKITNVANHLMNIYFSFFTKLIKLSQNTNNDDYDVYKKEINSKLILAVMSGINRAFPFSKIDDRVFENHINTLFIMVHNINFNTSIQALVLIFQISRFQQDILDRFYKALYESIQNFKLFNSSKQVTYLNLLFKAIKADMNKTRVKSFVKRLIQSANMHQVTFVCGIMILLHELEKIHPEIRSLYNKSYVYNVEKNDFNNLLHKNQNELFAKKNKDKFNSSSNLDKYDSRKRDPRYSNVDNSYLWELIPFLHHFHPTITSFAKSLLYGYEMPSEPNLSLYTLSHFLNKFIYRDPKTKISSQHSIMQSMFQKNNKNQFFLTKDKTFSNQSLSKGSFIGKKLDEIASDEVFYFKYFSQKHRQTMNNKKLIKASQNDSSKNENSDFEELESIEDDMEMNGSIYSMSDIDSQELDDNHLDFCEFENDLISNNNLDNLSQTSFNESMDEITSIISTGSKHKLNEKNSYIKRKKLKQLPVFASIDEYSNILEN